MNRTQKTGHMLLGAGIMLLGITIGQFTTPDIEAQRNGVFDKITCRSLSVIDEKGETEISLGDKVVVIRDKQGRLAVVLSSMETGNGLTVFGQGKIAGMLGGNKEENFVGVNDKQGQKAVSLSSRKEGNAVAIRDKQGKAAVVLLASIGGINGVIVSDKQGKDAARLSSNDKKNQVAVYDKQTGKKTILED